VFSYFSVKNSKNCDKFVIDTYESASHINIPEVTFSDCFYFETEKLRTGIYDIDTKITDLDTYIKEFDLQATTFQAKGQLWTSPFLENRDAPLPSAEGNFFFKEGETKKSVWQCLLDKNTGRMWFQIRWFKK
jgi:hypothetical protein